MKVEMKVENDGEDDIWKLIAVLVNPITHSVTTWTSMIKKIYIKKRRECWIENISFLTVRVMSTVPRLCGDRHNE